MIRIDGGGVAPSSAVSWGLQLSGKWGNIAQLLYRSVWAF